MVLPVCRRNVESEGIMNDTFSFIAAFACIMMFTLGATQIVDQVKGAQVTACSVTFKGYDGNKHQYIGTGELWK